MANLATVQTFVNTNLPDNVEQLITASIMRSVCNFMLTLDHNAFVSKQGGQEGEYYHLNLEQYNKVVELADDGDLYLPLAGGSMNNNAIVSWANGATKSMKINSIFNYIEFNAPDSLEGYAILADSGLTYEDAVGNTTMNAGGVIAQNGTNVTSLLPNAVVYTILASAKEHHLEGKVDNIEIGSTLAGFKGAKYAADFSANFVPLSLVHKSWVENYVQNVNNLNNYVKKAGDSMTLNAELLFSEAGATLKLAGNDAIFDNVTAKTTITPTSLIIENKTTVNNFLGLFAFDSDTIALQWSYDETIGIIGFYDDKILVFADGAVGFKGFQYSNDFSENFGTRSLVDKGWVENYVADELSGYVTNTSLGTTLLGYLPKAGGTMDDFAAVGWTNSGTSKKTSVNGNQFYAANDTDTTFTKLTNDSFTIQNTGANAVLSWLAAKTTLDFSGSGWWGLSVTGTGKRMAFGDWFSDTVPYMFMGEAGGIDSDKWEFYAQKGFFHRTGSMATTALITGTQAGLVGIKNESPTYDLDVTGDLNVTGNFRKGGVIGYIVSALGAASGVAPTLANCRTRTVTINGVTVKMVIEL